MNVDTFDSTLRKQEGANDNSFVESEVERLKQKIHHRKKRQKRIQYIFSGLTILVVFFALFASYSQYKLYRLAQDEKAVGSTNQQFAKTGEEVIKALSRHILLPEGVPQIAEIQDVEKVKATQAFFKNAENGDIVVVYDNASIFIYRPSKDIIIGAGDISGVGQANP